MDYEEKYKTALERARIWKDKSGMPKDKQGILDNIFPELAECEDEQHRKWILEYLYDGLRKSDEQFKGQFKTAIAWLEKQGQVKELTEIQHENKTCKENDDSLTSEDERIRKAISQCVEDMRGQFEKLYRVHYKDAISWLEKQRIKPQGKPALEAAKEAGLLKKEVEYPSSDEAQGTPVITIDNYCEKNCRGFQETGKCYADGSCDAKIKAEQNPVLSKEDNTKLRQIEYACMKFFGGDCSHVDWLRKFTRPQTTWKPTEEQMQALNEAVGIVGLFTPRGSYLKSLSEQLKRL